EAGAPRRERGLPADAGRRVLRGRRDRGGRRVGRRRDAADRRDGERAGLGIGSRERPVPERSERAGSLDEAEREDRLVPDGRRGVRERREESVDAGRIPDAAERERGARPERRVRVRRREARQERVGVGRVALVLVARDLGERLAHRVERRRLAAAEPEPSARGDEQRGGESEDARPPQRGHGFTFAGFAGMPTATVWSGTLFVASPCAPSIASSPMRVPESTVEWYVTRAPRPITVRFMKTCCGSSMWS